MVHQHFMLVPTLTVAENIMLGREPTSGAQLDTRARGGTTCETVAARYGLAVIRERLVADLSVGEAQRVEILKTALSAARRS